MTVFYILKCVSRYNVYVKEVNGVFYLLHSCKNLETAYAIIYYNLTEEPFRIIQKFIVK